MNKIAIIVGALLAVFNVGAVGEVVDDYLSKAEWAGNRPSVFKNLEFEIRLKGVELYEKAIQTQNADDMRKFKNFADAQVSVLYVLDVLTEDLDGKEKNREINDRLRNNEVYKKASALYEGAETMADKILFYGNVKKIEQMLENKESGCVFDGRSEMCIDFGMLPSYKKYYTSRNNRGDYDL